MMMQDNRLLLSICIPTDGNVNWILPVLDSIYSQKVDETLFEVVVTDNGENSLLPEHITQYHHANLRYIQTHDKGFLNLVTALKNGRGELCKMLNHRSVLLPGVISEWLSLVETYLSNRPIIFFSDGEVHGNDYIACKNIDELLKAISYWASWSAGISFWKEDIANIDTVEMDGMFPNTSLLLDIRHSPHYLVCNKKYQVMEDDAGKGGYNLFQTFAVGFLDLVGKQRIKRRIQTNTFIFVKRQLYDFLKLLYLSEVILPTQHTFELTGIKESMDVYYGRYYYRKMLFRAWIEVPFYYIKIILRRLSVNISA